MEIKDTINIGKDFTKEPGARYEYEGVHSGEEFLKTILRTKVEKAIAENYILSVELDGVIGYPSSFISGSFGLLSIEKKAEILLNHVQFVSSSQSKIQKFLEEINNPRTRPRTK